MASTLIHENVWFEKTKYEAAERQYYERLAKVLSGTDISFSLKSNSTVLIPSFKARVKQNVCLDNKNFADDAKCSDTSDKEVEDAMSTPVIVPTPNMTMPTLTSQFKDEKRSKKEKRNEKRNKNKDRKRDKHDQVRTSTISTDGTIEQAHPTLSAILAVAEHAHKQLEESKGSPGNVKCKATFVGSEAALEKKDKIDFTHNEIKTCHPNKKSCNVEVSDLKEKIEIQINDAVSRNLQSVLGGQKRHNVKSLVCSEGPDQYRGYVADLPLAQNVAKTCFARKPASMLNAPFSEPATYKAEQGMNLEKASSNTPMKNSLASEVAKARQHIKESLECMDDIAAMAGTPVDLINRINSLEKENADLNKIVADLKNLVLSLDSRVKSLEGGKTGAPAASITTSKVTNSTKSKNDDDDDDGVDLFGSDSEEESEEAAKVKEARLAAYAAKKSKKPALIAKSNIILSISPWDDETDMKKMEECVRTIEMDGLVWGASKLVPLAYGIHKLHISCVVEDDKVSVDLLQEKIQDFEDYVQSADIAAFNKV